jgi:hypothetical protein
METLATEFRKYGYTYRQTERQGDVAVYEQRDEDTDEFVAYEVFIVQKHEAREVFGKNYGAKELPPGSEMWGKEAYTVRTPEQVRLKAALLQGRLEERAKIALERKRIENPGTSPES